MNVTIPLNTQGAGKICRVLGCYLLVRQDHSVVDTYNTLEDAVKVAKRDYEERGGGALFYRDGDVLAGHTPLYSQLSGETQPSYHIYHVKHYIPVNEA